MLPDKRSFLPRQFTPGQICRGPEYSQQHSGGWWKLSTTKPVQVIAPHPPFLKYFTKNTCLINNIYPKEEFPELS